VSGGPSLQTFLLGMDLKSPVLNGSGTFDAIAAGRVFGEAALSEAHFPFSAYVSKTITEQPRAGNPPFRTWEAPAGMINSIGLPNPGLEGFIEGHLPALRDLPVPLIVSVMAEDRDGFARLVEAVSEAGGAAAFELNVSCPNVHSGLIVGESGEEVIGLLERLGDATDLPLAIKLTPNVARPEEIAEAAEQGGADAISLVNTIKASALDPSHDRPWLGAGSGGLSGPAIRPIAIQQVRAVAGRVSIPVIGMGGVTDGESALDFIRAGATAVAVGTENFRDPLAGLAVTEGLVTALERRGITGVDSVRGTVST
jgi:dihydroorotate dehydrogenase (NAD+) catalytic subunit